MKSRRRADRRVAILIAVAGAIVSCTATPAAAQPAAGPTNAANVGPAVEDPGPKRAVPASDPAVTAPPPARVPKPPKAEVAEKRSGWLDNIPLPILLTLLIALSTFISAIVSIWITPRTMRHIAAEQAEINRAAVAVAEQSAGAAQLGAAAAERSAEVSAVTAANVGIHEVARLRQEWINTLRNEVSSLNSDLVNWRSLPLKATAAEKQAHDQRVRDANARISKVQLLLNPREVASRRLLLTIGRLNAGGVSALKRLWLGRWIVRWAQIVLKTEWDRVRAELQGRDPPNPKRRGDRR